MVAAALAMAFLLSAPAPAEPASCSARPVAVQVDERFAAVLDELLDASPTFRRQCGRIEGEALVAIRTLPRAEEQCCRARATIRRYDSGVVIAMIELPALRTRAEYAELLGHEFEHILEQLEDVDLAARGEVIPAYSGHAYETRRAREAGLAVASEARRAGW